MPRVQTASARAPHRALPGDPATPVTGRRQDLDGLRGIAIALVVAFHVWAGRVSGGVDVFLVLSGFFFTGAVVRGAERSATVAVTETARRTARRLMPSLVVVLAAIAVATVVLRPYTQLGETAAQTLASMFYVQNWYLAGAELDYLAPDPSVSPLQHLWSMSVQGQFYLAIVAVLAGWAWLRRRHGVGRPALLLVLLGGGLVSFAYAVFGSAHHQAWTYYDSGARVWELLAGAALAVAAPWVRLPRRVRGLAAAAGLLMVLVCGPIFDGANQFPGVAALWPVAAACLVIVSGFGTGGAAAWPNRLLAGRICTELGAIAYPLYLWHWPILIFVLAETGRADAGLVDGLVVIGVSLVAAYLTTHLVETPLRLPPRGQEQQVGGHRVAGTLVTVLAVAVLVAASGWQAVLRANPAVPPRALDSELYPGAAALLSGADYPAEPMRPTVFEGQADSPPPTTDGCITPNREVRTCTYGDPAGARSIALVGGSHSEHWLPALELLGVEHGIRIVSYLKEGCPITLVDEPSYAEWPFPECREWTEEVLDRLAAEPPDWVLTLSTRYRMDGPGDEVPVEYLEVWTALQDRGLNVLALRDTPRLFRNGVLYRATDCLAHRGDADSCGLDRSAALSAIDPAREPAAGYPNVHLLDLSDAVCRPQRCRVVEGNVLIYRDEHHLTASYARSLAPELGRQIGAITGWW
ncbi:acyltransferase family protein [Nocardia rhizosphaerae]|uniref:Acyltransferase family protein n=1 Tax=Nocardia rhizosphaerae TaxID=1691571 RepID=A0ABV8KXQ3_9NOCA